MLHNDLNHLRRWPFLPSDFLTVWAWTSSLFRGSQSNPNTVMNLESPLAGVKCVIPLLISFTGKSREKYVIAEVPHLWIKPRPTGGSGLPLITVSSYICILYRWAIYLWLLWLDTAFSLELEKCFMNEEIVAWFPDVFSHEFTAIASRNLSWIKMGWIWSFEIKSG